MTLKIGLVGYGAIGRALADAIRRGAAGDATLVVVLDVFDASPFGGQAAEPLYTTDIHVFLAQDITLVVEAASQAMCREIAPQVLVAGKDLVPMSVGAFAEESFLQQMGDLAREHGRCIFLPSGAIGGLDALSAGAIDELDEVVLTTTKPPHALERAGLEQDEDLTTLTEPTCIYDGPATEAVRLFPKNVNVAAALSLAGAGVERTRVRIVADPEATGNSHRVEASGRFGAFTIELHLQPSPDNPRTSYLAVLSAIRTLKNLSEPIRFGG